MKESHIKHKAVFEAYFIVVIGRNLHCKSNEKSTLKNSISCSLSKYFWKSWNEYFKSNICFIYQNRSALFKTKFPFLLIISAFAFHHLFLPIDISHLIFRSYAGIKQQWFSFKIVVSWILDLCLLLSSTNLIEMQFLNSLV